MARTPLVLPDLVIPNGATDSNVMSSKVGFASLIDFIVYSPAALTGTVTVLVGADEAMAIANMVPLYANGSNVTVPAAKAVPVSAASFRSLAVQSGSAEGAARTFKVRGQVDLAS